MEEAHAKVADELVQVSMTDGRCQVSPSRSSCKGYRPPGTVKGWDQESMIRKGSTSLIA